MVSNLIKKVLSSPLGRKVIVGGILTLGAFSLAKSQTIRVWGAAPLPGGIPGTEHSEVDYRNITLNKAIGSTTLNSDGQYQLILNFADSSNIEYNIIDVNEVKNIHLYNAGGQKISEITGNKFDPNSISSGVYFYKLNLIDGNSFAIKSNILEGQMKAPEFSNQILVPKNSKGDTYYQTQANGDNNATLNELVGRYDSFGDKNAVKIKDIFKEQEKINNYNIDY